MTAFDKAWNLTKYSFDSRGEPNKVMSPSGRMRTGGNLPGPETLNEHLSDRDQNEHRLKESIMDRDHHLGRANKRLGDVESLLWNYIPERDRKMNQAIDQYNRDSSQYKDEYDRQLHPYDRAFQDSPSDPRKEPVSRKEHEDIIERLVEAMGMRDELWPQPTYHGTECHCSECMGEH
jgi:hypothetical protein